MADDSGRAVFSIRTIAGSWTHSGLGRVPKNKIACDTGSREEISEPVGLRTALCTLIQNTLKLEGFQIHRCRRGEQGSRRCFTWVIDLSSHDRNTRCLRMFVQRVCLDQSSVGSKGPLDSKAGVTRNDCTQDTEHANAEEDRHRFWAFESPF